MLDVSPNIYTHIYKWLKCFKYKCVLFRDILKNIENVKTKGWKKSVNITQWKPLLLYYYHTGDLK